MATKLHLDALGDDILDFVQSDKDATRRFITLDLVNDAVPGQANTYYVDKLATDHGYNVAIDSFGAPRIHVYNSGQSLLWRDESLWGSVDADFDIVRSLSTGPEGSAAVGSRNAIKLNFTPNPSTVIWFHYFRFSQAVG